MNIGTKSLLFGVHQFLWHPWCVARAWRMLHGKWPSWEVWVCVFFHDWGYWGKPNMDGPEGKTHPETGARITEWIIHKVALLLAFAPGDAREAGRQWGLFTRCHSCTAAKEIGAAVSALYYADKAAVLMESEWFYLLRAKASGEVWEYIDVALASKVWPESDRWFFVQCLDNEQQAKFWLRWYREKTKERIEQQRIKNI